MPISYTHSLGLASLTQLNNNYERKILSDGNRILLNYYEGQSFILSDHSVTGLQVTNDYTLGRYMELSIISRGPIINVPFSQAAPLFLSADKLPIDELLKIVYQKMEDRAPD